MTLDLFNTGDDPNDVDEPSDVEPIDVVPEPGAGQPAAPTAATVPDAADALKAIIAKHRADFDHRTYDYPPFGEPVKLARGSPEHAAVFSRRQPQWFCHIASIGRKGTRITYLDLIRSEARALLGRDTAAAVDGLL